MPDQPGGRLGTEALSEEQSSQRSRTIFNNAASGASMSPWKKRMSQFLAQRSVSGQQRPPVSPGQTSKTLSGAADPNVPGGPREVQTMQQQMMQQGATAAAPSQPIANPAGAPHNQPNVSSAAYEPKEASMEAKREARIEQVRALLKMAVCMKKRTARAGKRVKKADAEVPGVSVAAPLAAAGIGEGLGLAGAAGQRATAADLIPILQRISPRRRITSMVGGMKRDPLPALKQILAESKWKAYGLRPALSAATLAAPVWAGAGASKYEGGAGRGAAVGTGVGAGMGALGSLIGALVHRKSPALRSAILKGLPFSALGGAGVGAIGGTIGGGIQKRRRRKAQEQAGGKKEKGKSEKSEKAEKEAALLKRAYAKRRGLIKKAIGPLALALGIPAALSLGGAVLPPLFRAGRHHLEYATNPMYRQQHNWQRMMYSPQMMMLNMLRQYPGHGYGSMYNPQLNPEDRQMMQHATYLRGLRARTRALTEAFD